MLEEDLKPMRCGDYPLPVAVRVTVALNFHISGSFQESSGDISEISQSVAHCCIELIIDSSYQRVIAGFPWMQQVSDSMHVAIKSPAQQPGAFINRKGFHSLNVQLVCDHCKRILQVPQLFKPPKCLHGWILGDKGYALKRWHLTPAQHPNTEAEDTYNRYRATAKATIEPAKGLQRMKFWCLDRPGRALQYALSRISCIMVEDLEGTPEPAANGNAPKDPVPMGIDMRAKETCESLIQTHFS
ncbi:putative nuclease HARBI1 [Heterodontus francisci]|uniref:putative nuclease HARBI1 n=1 Tax=Heterodontus francisci TaxID=7792 RepID=UPI00355C715C